MTVTSEETKQPYASPVQERPEEPEIDLGLLWQGVWRRLPIIFLASLLIGGGAYFWAKSQPKVYEASATLLVTNTSAQQPEGFLTGLGSAPPLPDGVVAKVVRSPQVLGVVIQELQASSSLEVQERTRLVNALRDELRLQNLKTLTLSGSGNLTLIGCRAVTDRKPYRHRFPLSVIGYALRLYHRFPPQPAGRSGTASRAWCSGQSRDPPSVEHQVRPTPDRGTAPSRTPPGFSMASGRGLRQGRRGQALVVASGRRIRGRAGHSASGTPRHPGGQVLFLSASWGNTTCRR